MAVEFDKAPACCRKTMSDIQEKIDSFGCLGELLAAAPAIVQPRVSASVPGALWQIGKGIWSSRKNLKHTSKLLDPILTNRVKTLIDFELINHQNDRDLSTQWAKFRKEFER